MGNSVFSQANDDEVLDELTLDFTKNKQDLIQILTNSKKIFEKYQKKSFYYFVYSIEDENNEQIEEISSFIRYKNLGYVLYGYDFKWIMDKEKLEPLQYMSATSFFSFFTNYSLFRNEMFFENLLKLINDSDLSFKDNIYYIYADNKLSTDLIFKVDKKNDILLEFINKNKVLIRENVNRQERQLQSSDVVTKFVYNENHYTIKEMRVIEQYLVNGQMLKIDFKSNLSENSKKEVQKMDSKSMLGFVMKYTRKKKEFIGFL